MKEEISFNVIMKDGKPYLRANHFYGNQKNLDMKIWKASSDKPYCKYMSNYLGLLYLDKEMITELRRLQAGGSSRERESLFLTPEQFAANI